MAASSAPPKFDPLPGRAVGVLVSGCREVLSEQGRHGPSEAVCFARGDASYRWVFVPAGPAGGGQALSFGLGTPRGATREYRDVAVLDDARRIRLGIEAGESLVEVEVNGGAGSPAEDRFVATRIKILDGTIEYSLRVDRALLQCKEDYERHLHDSSGPIGVVMSEARKQALGARAPTGPRGQEDHQILTWLPREERLRIRLTTRYTDGLYDWGSGTELKPIVGDGSSAVRPPGDPQGSGRTRYGTEFGVDTGAVYEVSRSGRVEKTEYLRPRPFTRILPPPMAPRAPGTRSSRPPE